MYLMVRDPVGRTCQFTLHPVGKAWQSSSLLNVSDLKAVCSGAEPLLPELLNIPSKQEGVHRFRMKRMPPRSHKSRSLFRQPNSERLIRCFASGGDNARLCYEIWWFQTEVKENNRMQEYGCPGNLLRVHYKQKDAVPDSIRLMVVRFSYRV